MEKRSQFFDDGLRTIDYVIVWKIPKAGEGITEEIEKAEKRRIFEENLINEGLQIERTVIDDSINFVKIHAPLNVLLCYAEIINIKLPMNQLLYWRLKCTTHDKEQDEQIPPNFIQRFKKNLTDEENFPPIPNVFSAVYSRDKHNLFDTDNPEFLTPLIRARIVQFILDRQIIAQDQEQNFAFGINRLVNDKVYVAAYGLHDGDIAIPGSRRHLLYTHWAAMKKWYQIQPIDHIKEYFGVKIGIYFAWLGFYTYMLTIASVVGVICFLISLKWMLDNPVTDQICNKDETILMCPLCDAKCDYEELSNTCQQVRVTSLIDNPVTVFFAVFMSFWAALFLELWKRFSAKITHRWDLTGFDAHEKCPRPQYLERLKSVKKFKTDAITNATEPKISWKRKVPATFMSFSVVILLIVLLIAAIFGVILYRISMIASLSVYGGEKRNAAYVSLFTTITAAIINLVLIMIFNKLYESLAEWLTEFELHRTQTEFDDSLALKIYFLQFVNYYSSIFYIAFFKGNFVGTPKEYNRLFGYRQEECSFSGCFMELMIQLAIIMIGKQFLNALFENILPIFIKKSKEIGLKTKNPTSSWEKHEPRYQADLKLLEFGARGLFPEYLEMVLQYGFVTIFVAAFPLAPLFALINNICEMRLDAKKFLAYHQRPVLASVRNIGVWYRLLDGVSKLAVITNGFIIAFTSDFIPRLVYYFYYSNRNLNGYVEFALSKFKVQDFQENTAPLQSRYENVTECRYRDFRNPPGDTDVYNRTIVYWNILAARLLFVVIFENVIAFSTILIRWLIPDVSNKLKNQIKMEAFITNEIASGRGTWRNSVLYEELSETEEQTSNL